jgi:hypothetical protein
MFKSCRMKIPVKRVTDSRSIFSKNQKMINSQENRKREYSLQLQNLEQKIRESKICQTNLEYFVLCQRRKRLLNYIKT